jgi:hypothetical protein
MLVILATIKQSITPERYRATTQLQLIQSSTNTFTINIQPQKTKIKPRKTRRDNVITATRRDPARLAWGISVTGDEAKTGEVTQTGAEAKEGTVVFRRGVRGSGGIGLGAGWVGTGLRPQPEPDPPRVGEPGEYDAVVATESPGPITQGPGLVTLANSLHPVAASLSLLPLLLPSLLPL